MNQLVYVTTEDLSNQKIITDSIIVSEEFEKDHKTVLRDVRKLYKELEEILEPSDFSRYKIVQLNYTTERGRKYSKVGFNRSFFMMLAMGYNTKKALKIKNLFIKQFDFMEHELIVRGETRHIGITIRKDMTKSICENIPEGNFKKYAISNYTGLVYKKVLGTTLKKWKESNNIPKGEKNRNFLTKDQLENVQYYESKIADIIEVSSGIVNEKELYQKIKEFVNKQKGRINEKDSI